MVSNLSFGTFWPRSRHFNNSCVSLAMYFRLTCWLQSVSTVWINGVAPGGIKIKMYLRCQHRRLTAETLCAPKSSAKRIRHRVDYLGRYVSRKPKMSSWSYEPLLDVSTESHGPNPCRLMYCFRRTCMSLSSLFTSCLNMSWQLCRYCVQSLSRTEPVCL